MRIFRVKMTSFVTILQEETVSVGAIDEADAITMAQEAFSQIMEEKHGWADFDEIKIEECVEC